MINCASNLNPFLKSLYDTGRAVAAADYAKAAPLQDRVVTLQTTIEAGAARNASRRSTINAGIDKFKTQIGRAVVRC